MQNRVYQFNVNTALVLKLKQHIQDSFGALTGTKSQPSQNRISSRHIRGKASRSEHRSSVCQAQCRHPANPFLHHKQAHKADTCIFYMA